MDLKLEKWEPTRAGGRIPDGIVPIYKSSIVIPEWATKYLSDVIDIYYDLKARVIGLKPSGTTRKARKQSSGRGKLVACSELIRKLGIAEKRLLCKAEWSKTHKMLLVHLEG